MVSTETWRPCPRDGSAYHRAISYLRVSITDRCNLRCAYCMPEEGVASLAHEEILRYEEIARLVRVAAELGISHVRVTGGEPLVRRGVEGLIAMIAAVPGIEEVSMTTNGTLLAGMAEGLARAGLRRVNVSLDTLRPERYRSLTRGGRLDDVLRGLEAARHAGLEPIKVNAVVMRGANDDEIGDLAQRTVDDAWHVRFIELMPLGEISGRALSEYVSSDEIKRRVEERYGELEPAQVVGNGPARYWRIPGAAGTLGFISAISEHFCARCNRLRLTSDGKLMPCLFSDLEFDLRTPLRSGATDEELRAIFLAAIRAKPDRHHLAESQGMPSHAMSRLGG
ncbi:MAG: GTP 3',8-cyclase MoaA [Chloroflexi bacterium]|nr:GTP 3',8-cyclase MoaA [Chloroflexota bacterium]